MFVYRNLKSHEELVAGGNRLYATDVADKEMLLNVVQNCQIKRLYSISTRLKCVMCMTHCEL